MTVLAPVAHTVPWGKRPDESIAEYGTFLLWAFTPDRASLQLTPEASSTAARHGWWLRAAQLEAKLAPPKSLTEVTQSIASDAVTILHVELAALAAQSRANPGQQRLKDLTALLQLVAGMGGFNAVAKNAPSTDEAGVDYSQLDADELACLARASHILAKAKRLT